MAQHPRSLILQAVEAGLADLATTGPHVYRGRPVGDDWLQPDELPALVIGQGGDQRIEGDTVDDYWLFEVVIEAVVTGPDEQVEELINQVEMEVTDAILETEKPWLGLPAELVVYVEHVATAAPIAAGTGDRPAAAAQMTWQFHYQRGRRNFGL